MPKTKFALWLFDADLFDKFKAKAAHRAQPLNEAVKEAVELYLHPPMLAADKPVKPRKPVVARADVAVPCRRCGHARLQHSPRGCVMGCACGSYVAPA